MKNKTGRFDNITSESYHKELTWAYSCSDLKKAIISPSNLILRRNGPSVDSDAKQFGRAFHARMEHFNNEGEYLKLVAVPPSITRASTVGKEAHAKFEAENVGKIHLDQKDWDKLENMLLAVKHHPDANALLTANGLNEETFIWQDKDTGVMCKCRPDKRLLAAPVGLPDHMIVDWKTTADASPRALRNDIAEYSYHVQAAFYLDGISSVLGHDVGPFVNVFIEKGSDFQVVCAVMSDAAIEEGRRVYKDALSKIAECEKTGVWPGFVDFDLPAWASLSG